MIKDEFGVEFSDDMKTLERCPEDLKGGYVIPDMVTSIGESAFFGCAGLMSVTLPDGVAGIGYRMFRDCANLTSVTILNSETDIGGDAFRNCSGLTSVTILNSETDIVDGAFLGGLALKEIIVPKGSKQRFMHDVALKDFKDCIVTAP